MNVLWVELTPTAVPHLDLMFSDGFHATLPAEKLGMPLHIIVWPTVALDPKGDGIVVVAIKGEVIPLSARVLRYLTDPVYAADVESKVRRLTREEWSELARENPIPDEFFDSSGDPDDCILPSWRGLV